MKTRKLDTRRTTAIALLIGLMLVMSISGIGFVPLPLIKATTMHIPVVLGAILLGPGAGAVLGAVFGLCSIWTNTTAPSILSFAFSPFMTTEGIAGVLKSLWIALGCRILFGLIAGWIWKLLKTRIKFRSVSVGITAVVSTLCHTILVMGSIYILLAQQYAQAENVGMSAVFGLILTTVATSGVSEAIVAAVVIIPVGLALLKFFDHTMKQGKKNDTGN